MAEAHRRFLEGGGTLRSRSVPGQGRFRFRSRDGSVSVQGTVPFPFNRVGDGSRLIQGRDPAEVSSAAAWGARLQVEEGVRRRSETGSFEAQWKWNMRRGRTKYELVRPQVRSGKTTPELRLVRLPVRSSCGTPFGSLRRAMGPDLLPCAEPLVTSLEVLRLRFVGFRRRCISTPPQRDTQGVRWSFSGPSWGALWRPAMSLSQGYSLVTSVSGVTAVRCRRRRSRVGPGMTSYVVPVPGWPGGAVIAGRHLRPPAGLLDEPVRAILTAGRRPRGTAPQNGRPRVKRGVRG